MTKLKKRYTPKIEILFVGLALSFETISWIIEMSPNNTTTSSMTGILSTNRNLISLEKYDGTRSGINVILQNSKTVKNVIISIR